MRARRAAEGHRRAEPPLEPAAGPPSGSAGYATARLRGHCRPPSSRSIEDELFRFARIVESTPALRSALDRPRPAARGRARAWSTSCSRARCQPATLRLVALRGRRRPAPGHRGHAGLAGRADGRRPGAGGSPGCGRPRRSTTPSGATWPSRSAALAGRPGRAAGGRRRRPARAARVVQIGDLQVDATARGRLDALREHLVPGGWETGRIRPGPTSGEDRQREQTDGRADDRRQRDHRGAASATSTSTPPRSAPSRSAGSSRWATASPGCRACPARR